MYRKIIHVDMDAFYASVEQRDNPQLRGLPIAVGHSESRGVVATASYEARRRGVRSAMPSTRALRICPELIMVEPRFQVYKEVSAAMHEIFHEYTDMVEPISLDEAFLDVTENKPGIELAVDIAREIKSKIKSSLQLTASAGISYNKFLAKVASDMRKPDGLCTIHPSKAQEVIDSLPVECFWGVGPVTAKRMHKLGIDTGLQLRAQSKGLLMSEFGKAGRQFYDFAHGIDNRKVEARSERKSVSCEQTMAKDLTSREEAMAVIDELSVDLMRRIDRANFEGSTLTLKLRFGDFSTRSRSKTVAMVLADADTIAIEASQLFDKATIPDMPVRLIGLGVTKSQRESSESSICDFYEGGWRQLLIDFDEDY